MRQYPGIRPAKAEDASEIGVLVQTTIRISNARDYPAAVIDSLVACFSCEAVMSFIAQRSVLVAVDAKSIVGTASLHGAMVKTVFVHPSMQGRGIGHRLVNSIEGLAKEQGLTTVRVRASLTAESFYARLGYVAITEEWHGDERTILMEKNLD